MRVGKQLLLTVVSCLILAGSVLAQDVKEDKQSALLYIPAAELQWKDLDPAGAPGVKVVTFWGDHQKGAFGALFKLPPGFSVAMHTHTHDMKVVIVSGTYIQVPEGKPEFRLGAGSYMMQPGGNYRHTTSCDSGSECIFFVESDGPFDLHVVKSAEGED